MNVVYKYSIESAVGDQPAIIDTIAGQIVHVGLDPKGWWCIWVCGDPDSSFRRQVLVIGTGFNVIPEKAQHVGSFMDGPLMLHVFTI